MQELQRFPPVSIAKNIRRSERSGKKGVPWLNISKVLDGCQDVAKMNES